MQQAFGEMVGRIPFGEGPIFCLERQIEEGFAIDFDAVAALVIADGEFGNALPEEALAEPEGLKTIGVDEMMQHDGGIVKDFAALFANGVFDGMLAGQEARTGAAEFFGKGAGFFKRLTAVAAIAFARGFAFDEKTRDGAGAGRGGKEKMHFLGQPGGRRHFPNRFNFATDDGEAGAEFGEAVEETLQPVGIDRAVVIDMGHERGLGRAQTAIAGAGKAGDGFIDRENTVTWMAGSDLSNDFVGIVGAGIVDDADFETRRVERLGAQTFEALFQERGAVISGEVDADITHEREKNRGKIKLYMFNRWSLAWQCRV